MTVRLFAGRGRKLVRIFSILCLAACLGNKCSGSSKAAPPQSAGNFVTLNQHHYPGFENGDVLHPLDCMPNPDVPVVTSRATANGWSHIENVEDDPGCSWWTPAVHASNFSDSTAKNADFIWFSGHGDNGTVSLYNYSPQQAIDDGGFDCSQGNPDITCFWGQSAGLPTSGRLKWIMAVASFDANDANWQYAFNTNTSGLHGYYAIDGEPNGDIGDTFANHFLNDAIASGPLSIRDAWMNAVTNVFGVHYGVWELADASGDVLSGGGSVSTGVFSSTNPLRYTNTIGTYVIPQSLQALNSTPGGMYTPIALTTESYSDTSLTSQSNAYSTALSTGNPDGNTYQISTADYNARHYEASQGIIVSGPHSFDPFNYTQSDTQTFAEQFMSGQGRPLPSDAILQTVQAVYTTPLGAAPILMGYQFTYGHADGTFGGDAIRIGVDNYKKRVCLQYNENDPPYNKPPCLQWGFEYDQHVNDFYRLWRTRSGSTRYPLGQHGSGGSALSSSQAYAIASTSAQIKGMSLGTLQGYVYSYWTPSISSLDNTAYPAYHFYFSSHTVVSADAYSGQILGVEGGLN